MRNSKLQAIIGFKSTICVVGGVWSHSWGVENVVADCALTGRGSSGDVWGCVGMCGAVDTCGRLGGGGAVGVEDADGIERMDG